MDYIKVKAVQDDSGHWYVIPNELEDTFDAWCYDESKEDDFIKLFSCYMTGGDLNNIQLYTEL